jgi:hypothetical protein
LKLLIIKKKFPVQNRNMPNVIENRESLLNKVVLANQSIGVVRYIGPLQDFKDNSGL